MEEQISIYYDEEGDYLEVLFKESEADYGDHLSEDIVLFRDQKTKEILGIGIYNFKLHTQELNDLRLKLPVKINLSALKV